MDIKGVREALHRNPFTPFTICLADGKTEIVPHPDFVAIAGERRIVVVRQDETWAVIEPLLIVSLEYEAEAASKGNGAPG